MTICPQNSQQLERLIDVHGLKAVLCEIADICGAKADHVSTNWQDPRLASKWDVAKDQVQTAACKLPVLL